MASTASPLIKAELQTLGENANLWGDPNLNNALKCFEESSKGFTTVAIGASDVTLASTNFTPSVSQHFRYATLRLTADVGVGARNVIVPGVAGRWTVHNATAFTQTVKTSGSSVVATVAPNEILTVYCDGTDCYNQTSGTVMASGTLTGALNWAAAVTVASATTTDIGAAASNAVIISGTVTITGLGTIASGAMRAVRFSGALTLTHNATSLILPGAANITTAAGDTAVFLSEGSGNWRCLAYQLASAGPLRGQIPFPATQNSSSDANTLDDYEEGTFTPAVAFGGGSTGLTYSSRTGFYTKVGRVVHAYGQVTLSAKGSSTGNATITGLPFTLANENAAGAIAAFTMVTSAPYFAYATSGTTTINVYEQGGTGVASANTDFNNTSSLYFNLVYATAT